MKTKTMQVADIVGVIQSWFPVRIRGENALVAKSWCAETYGETFSDLHFRCYNNIVLYEGGKLFDKKVYSDSVWDHSGYAEDDTVTIFLKHDKVAVEVKLRFG